MNITIENLDFSNVDKYLTHLSNEQITELIAAYYSGEDTIDLLTKYDIKASASRLVKIFPPFVSEELCVYCASPVRNKFRSRSYSTNRKIAFCAACGHQETSSCTCTHCKEKKLAAIKLAEEYKQKQLEEKKELLRTYFDRDNWERVLEKDLSLEDRLYLAVILRGALSEDTSYIEPLETIAKKIAPTPEFECQLIKTLTGRDILIPSIQSKVNEFEIEYLSEDEAEYEIRYNIYGVKYWLNIQPTNGDYYGLIKRLMYPDLSDEVGFQEFCYVTWKQVALHETLQYLLYQMKKVGYSFQPGEKTIKVFEEILEHFSVSQVYSIIYRAVANSTQRYQAREITKIHAQNSVITACENFGQRAVAQGWQLTHYSRLYDLPETYISTVLFTSIMQIAELGFTEKPTSEF